MAVDEVEKKHIMFIALPNPLEPHGWKMNSPSSHHDLDGLSGLNYT